MKRKIAKIKKKISPDGTEDKDLRELLNRREFHSFELDFLMNDCDTPEE